MRHGRGNEADRSLGEVSDDCGDDGSALLHRVYMRRRPTLEHPEGEIEADWWVTGQTTNKGVACYVIAKRGS